MKTKQFTLRSLSFFLFVILSLLTLSSCGIPPKGYSRDQSSYEEVVEFAHSIDPNATVSQNFTDSLFEGTTLHIREWDAVIFGVECHVSCVEEFIYEFAGEFGNHYWKIETDYAYYQMQEILSKRETCWSVNDQMTEQDPIFGRYSDDVLSMYHTQSGRLSDDELENAWQEAVEIAEEWDSYFTVKGLRFCFASPETVTNWFGEHNLRIGIDDLSEEGKQAFLKEYREKWADPEFSDSTDQ